MKNKLLLTLLTGAIAVGMVACVAPVASTDATATSSEAAVVSSESASTEAASEVVTETVTEEVSETSAETVAETASETSADAPAEALVAEALVADTSITLGDTIEIVGEGAAVSDNGVSITQGGTYLLQGTLADGVVEITAPDEAVTLLLNGVSITNSNGPAIVFYASSESNVTLVDGTVNTLADGGEHDDYDGTLWSSATLNIDGAGELHVTGEYQEGIASEMHININGGSIWVTSFDDGLNANNDNVSIITMNDGFLFVNAGGDGLDSNGAITFNGGTVITMSALTDMSGGIDADGAVTINGGTVIATGARNSTPATDSTQKSLVVSYTSAQTAETLAAIVDPDGVPLLIFAPEVAYQELVYSGPEVADDVTYTVYTGGTVEGEAQNGWYADGTYTPGTEVSTVDTASVSSGGFGPGGMGPGGPGGQGGPGGMGAPGEDGGGNRP